MHVVFLLASLAFGDASRLADDSFNVREGASTRLAFLGELSRPALLLASRSGDLEQRKRARLLLGQLNDQRRETVITAAALWVFFGPRDDWNHDLLVHPRMLHRNERLVERWPEWLAAGLAERAVCWRLLSGGQDIPLVRGRRSVWIGVARHRAYGLPNPYPGFYDAP